MEVKKCSKCKEDKPVSRFNKRGDRPNSYRSQCKDCASSALVSSYNKRYSTEERAQKRRLAYLSNKDAALQSCAKWRDANRGRIAETSKAWRENNKERVKSVAAEWRENNRDVFNAKAARRRASVISRQPDWLTDDHHFVIREIYDAARLRSEMTGVAHHVDHIIPLQGKLVSGLHVPWNLQVLDAKTNLSKSNNYEV